MEFRCACVCRPRMHRINLTAQTNPLMVSSMYWVLKPKFACVFFTTLANGSNIYQKIKYELNVCSLPETHQSSP